MNRVNIFTFAVVPITFTLLVGCGAGPGGNNVAVAPTNRTNIANTTARPGQTVVMGAQGYAGAANLRKFETLAAQKPNDANAQIQAGVSAHVNRNDNLALQYYQKAIRIAPESGVAYNNVGNIYFRDRNDLHTAIAYYSKATQVQPTYAYGWWNLALVQMKLGQKSIAQQTVARGLKVVPKTDPNYKNLANTVKS